MKKAEFRWGKLSYRQRMIMSWWTPGSPYADYDGIIADGAIRSGKTVSMGFSFAVWAMSTYNGVNFAMCGKTIESLRRNCIVTMKRQLKGQGYQCREKKSENLLIVSKKGVTNYFYLFGGKDEGSQDLIQGITLAGVFFDEVALMPESFVNQATARCSVDGSKFWFNCNPGSPMHWFYQRWIRQAKKRRLVYLHFTMSDNLTLTEKIRKRYEAQYTGVFYMRYILGLWAAADGLIYDMFDKLKHVLKEAPETEGDYYISSDYGIQNATVFLLWRRIKGTKAWVCIDEYCYSGRDNKRQKTVQELADGMESIIPKDARGKPVKIEQIIVDPSAAALIVELRKRGYSVKKANNDVLDGIADVSTMLGQGNLLFLKTCKNTIGEFAVYIWDEKAANNGEDKPVKVNDHSMDAVRYFVRTLKLVKREEIDEDTLYFLD